MPKHLIASSTSIDLIKPLGPSLRSGCWFPQNFCGNRHRLFAVLVLTGVFFGTERKAPSELGLAKKSQDGAFLCVPTFFSYAGKTGALWGRVSSRPLGPIFYLPARCRPQSLLQLRASLSSSSVVRLAALLQIIPTIHLPTIHMVKNKRKSWYVLCSIAWPMLSLIYLVVCVHI